MGANVINIQALVKDPSDDHVISILLHLDLGVGLVSKVRDVIDDLGNNRVEVHYSIIGQTDEPDHNPIITTRVRTQNPYILFDENHKFIVYAHEAGQTDISDEMETSDAHRN